MKVKLESFRYLPREPQNWGTRSLHFGDMITVVQGANGSGKTPIMKGIMQGLGHEVELPPAIQANCSAAELTLSTALHKIVLTRSLQSSFELRVSEDGENHVFHSEADYARWFNGLLSIEPRQVVTKKNEASELYMTLLAPSFWVDQDHGWTTNYWTPAHRNFIKDQRQEVIRYLVGLPPRHQLNERNKFEAAKDELARSKKAVELQRFVIERLRTNEALDESEEPALVAQKIQLSEDLAANSDAIEAIRSAAGMFDTEIRRLEDRRGTLISRKDELIRRKGQLELVFAELGGEEEVLAANVQASDIFHRFCGRSDCEIFPASQRSFGRSLLFLKDQLKDLRSADRSLARELADLDKQLQDIHGAIGEKRAERGRVIDASPQAAIAAKLSALTRGLVAVELRLAKIHQYATEQRKFAQLLSQLDQAESLVSELRPTRGNSLTAAEDVRKLLGEAMQIWLKALGTSNTAQAEFDQDFGLYVDDELFSDTSHQSGSTRTRIVLAFHAAVLEVALMRNGNHPGWLLFDAPKQHELSQQDFDNYTDRLVLMSQQHGNAIQVVFSVADWKTQLEVGDEIWAPEFQIEGRTRFLGRI